MANVNDLYNKGFGQMGSVFNDGTAAITPPSNRVFIAITFLAETTFDSSGGLKADTSNDSIEFVGTEAAAHNLSVGSETAISGGGGQQIDASNTFPKGMTIYGRWTEIDPASGTLIAYIGD
tara:strand:+ start:138 stop:500 length:363 start_codon:yes stop_codon:yes gene_type:complete